MNTQQLWCAACNRTVEVVLEEVASSAIAPLIGGTAGGAIGKARGGWEHAIAGAVLGTLVGLALHSLTPKAQHLVCGNCRMHLA